MWQGIDHGREGLLRADTWLGILRVLARHEGEDLRNVRSPVYRELEQEFPDTSWTGADQDRPFFRDYGKAWTRLGVLLPNRSTDGTLTLTEAGRALAQDPQRLRDFVRHFVDSYYEIWQLDGYTEPVAPLETVAIAVLGRRRTEIEECRRLAEEHVASELGSLPEDIFDQGATNRRRFRTYLTMLENAGAISNANGSVVVTDPDYLSNLIRAEVQLRSTEQTMAEDARADEDLQDDLREYDERRVAVREGQRDFARRVSAAYGNQCCMTGTSEARVLDAAHIARYLGPHTNGTSNGLLLAVDVHRLFDRNLIAVDPDSMRIVLHESVADPRYATLAGQSISLPKDPADRPSEASLRRRLLELRGEDPRDV